MLEHVNRDKRIEQVAQGSVDEMTNKEGFMYKGDPAAIVAEVAVEEMEGSGIVSTEEAKRLAPVFLGATRHLEKKFAQIYFNEKPGFEGASGKAFDKLRDDVSTEVLSRFLEPALEAVGLTKDTIRNVGIGHLGEIAVRSIGEDHLGSKAIEEVRAMNSHTIADALIKEGLITEKDWFLGQFRSLPSGKPSNSDEIKATMIGVHLANVAWKYAQIPRAARRNIPDMISSKGSPNFGSFEGMTARMFEKGKGSKVGALFRSEQVKQWSGLLRVIYELAKDLGEVKKVAE